MTWLRDSITWWWLAASSPYPSSSPPSCVLLLTTQRWGPSLLPSSLCRALSPSFSRRLGSGEVTLISPSYCGNQIKSLPSPLHHFWGLVKLLFTVGGRCCCVQVGSLPFCSLVFALTHYRTEEVLNWVFKYNCNCTEDESVSPFVNTFLIFKISVCLPGCIFAVFMSTPQFSQTKWVTQQRKKSAWVKRRDSDII